MSYRLARVDGTKHAEHLKHLHWLTFNDTAPQIDPRKGFWGLAHDEHKDIAGFCGLSQSSYSKNFGYLKRAGVLEAHRGRGLQLRMIRVREAHAKKLGLAYIITDTTDNPASANTLIRAGYKLFRPRHPWGPLAETLYWKRTINNG